MQVKFLRAVKERTFLRVGGTVPIAVDVRIVASGGDRTRAALDLGVPLRKLAQRMKELGI